MRSGKIKKFDDALAERDAPKMARLPGRLAESARLQEDRRSHDRMESDRRRDERMNVDAQASLCATFNNNVHGHLDNLSIEGCRLNLQYDAFKIGDAVWFKIDSLQPWKGTVRWVSKGKVGVEFDRPFYPAVFEMLIQMNKPVRCSNAA